MGSAKPRAHGLERHRSHDTHRGLDRQLDILVEGREGHVGQEDAADLRAPLRASDDPAVIGAAIDEAIGRKPKGHDFIIDRRSNKPSVSRHMSVTGG